MTLTYWLLFTEYRSEDLTHHFLCLVFQLGLVMHRQDYEEGGVTCTSGVRWDAAFFL